MSEIICFYNYADNDKESGCFILESNVELNDFKEFLVQSNIMEESQILLDTDNKPIESEETFTTMKDDAVVNNTTLSFIIASPAPEPVLPAPVEEEKKVEEPFGPLIKQLLNTFNINNLSNITQLNDIIDCIPFPFSMMARGYLANIRANPNAIEQIVQSLAPAYSAQAAPLIAEVTRAFDFFDRKEREKQEEQLRLQREEEEAREAELARQERAQREREAQLEKAQQQQQKSQPEVKEREFIGPIMQQLLEKVGVELNITAADISMLVRYIPSNYRGLVLRVVRELAANVFYVNYAIRYVAQLLNVSENALVREVHHAFNCFRRAVSSLKVEESKDQVKHQAICDNCQTFITGIRYKCLHCPDYDLCNKCEEENSDFHFHDETHVFAKIINPSHSLPASRGGHRMGGCHPHMRARHNRIASLEASVEELKKAVAALSENKL